MRHLSLTACLILTGAVSACGSIPVTLPGMDRGTHSQSQSVAGAEALIRSLFEASDWEGTGGSREARLGWMTPELADASLRLDAATDNIGVGMEPSVGSSYIHVTEASYRTRATSWGAEVHVRFLNTNEPRETWFEMIRTEAGWRVADIVGRDPVTGRTWRYTDQMAEVFAAVARGQGPRDPS